MNYSDHKKMIYKIAWSLKKKNPKFEINDLISEANLIFVKCTRLFDESRKVKFSTFLYSALNKQLLFYIKKSNRLSVSYIEKEIESNENFAFFDLSETSKSIVNYVLNLPRKESKKKIAKAIHQETGIEYKNIQFYFEEIKECLI